MRTKNSKDFADLDDELENISDNDLESSPMNRKISSILDDIDDMLEVGMEGDDDAFDDQNDQEVNEPTSLSSDQSQNQIQSQIQSQAQNQPIEKPTKKVVDEEAGFLDAEEGSEGFVLPPEPPMGEDDLFAKFKAVNQSFGMNSPTIGLKNPNPLQQIKKDQSSNTSTNPTKKEGTDDEDQYEEGVLEWCEKFSFRPGIEFIRLKRVHPKIWEGIPMAGWIEDIYEPIDERYLVGRWGGGTYQLEAVQLDRAQRAKTTERKIITISGLPTHFVDEKGEPHKLPPSSLTQGYNQNSHSRREESMLGRNQSINKFRNNDGFDPSYTFKDESTSTKPQSGFSQGPNAIAASAAELLRGALSQSENRKEDHKALEILRSAQNDVQSQMAETSKQQQEIYKEMLNNQRAEIERMRREQDIILEKAQKPLSEALNLVTNRADNEVLSLREQVQKMELEYRDRLTQLREEQSRSFQIQQKEKEELRLMYSSQIDTLKNEHNRLFQTHQREKEDLNKLHLTQLDAIRQEFRQKEVDIKTQAQQSSSENFQSLKLQMDSLRDNHQAQVSNLQKEHQAVVNQLYQEVNKLREDARERESKAREEAFKRESELRMTHIKEVSDLKSDLNDRLSQLRLESERREKELKEAYAKNEKDMKETFAKSEKEARHSADLREKELRDRFDERERVNKETLETKYSNTIESLKEKLEFLRSNSDEKIQNYMKDIDRRESMMKTSLETNYKSQMAIIESEKNRLQSELDSLKRELDVARRERKELTDPIAKLKEIRNFKETLQEFGFVSESDSAEKLINTQLMTTPARIKDDDDDGEEEKKEAPKGILGNLAKYGPQIAQNIIAPVLQRVDNATRLASDALENQKQELNQQAKILEIQSQEMEQRRIKMEQEASVMKAQQFQAMQQAQQRGVVERRRRGLQDTRFGNEMNGQGGGLIQSQDLALVDPNAQQVMQQQAIRRQQALQQQAMQQQAMQQQAMQQQAMQQQALQQQALQRQQMQQVQRVAQPQVMQQPQVQRVAQPQVQTQPIVIPQQIQPTMEARVIESTMTQEVLLSDTKANNEPKQVKAKRPSITAGLKPSVNSVELTNEEQFNGGNEVAPEVVIQQTEKKNPIPKSNRKSILGETIKTIEIVEANQQQVVDAPTPIQEVVIDSPKPTQTSAAKDAYAQLSEFIHQNLTQGTDTDMVTLQLTFASTTGKIPRDVFAETIQAPFEELYENIKTVANEKGYKNLLTTKGQAYCQKIYNGLNPTKPKRSKK